MSFFDWITAVFSSFPLAVITFLTVGVMFVNGWTDAPNAIASCVSTRALSPKQAVTLAAVCNFIGLSVSVAVNRTVADTIFQMVDFGTGRQAAQVALCAGLLAVVVWAVSAWYFGIPTSESHALIAGITGAAFAVKGVDGIRFSVWSRILWGLAVSVVFGFIFGYAFSKRIVALFQSCSRQKIHKICRWVQIFGGVANSLLHGAQDGQKFIGVLLLSAGASAAISVSRIPWWMVLFCSGVLFFGTSLGGYRIIRAVGMKMVRLRDDQGVASDLASAVCLLFCTVTGLPVSTTHVKTTAVMGCGAAHRIRSVQWQTAGEMAAAWLLTFPGCGLLGYGAAKLFLSVF